MVLVVDTANKRNIYGTGHQEERPAGGVVTVQDASLPEGAEAEVIVLVGEAVCDEPSPLPLAEIVGSAKGLYATPEDIDQYIRDLRDEWD